MTNDLVSVIVPVYNSEKYLDRCVNSIVNQTYENLEIILVDDGSRDSSSYLCDKWAERDERILVIHKVNAGAGMARNTGIEQATGAFVVFCDSDDYIAPVTIENAYNQMKLYSAQVVVYGMQDVNKNGCIVRNELPEGKTLIYTGDAVQTKFLPDLIDNRHRAAGIKNLHLSFCPCMFVADLLKQSKWRIVSEREFLSEDSYSLIWLYFHVKTVVILPENNYYCCENDMSLSHSYGQNQYWRIRQFYRDCHALADSLGYCTEVHKSISGLFLSFSIATLKQLVATDMEKSEKMKLLRQIINDEIMQQGIADVSQREYGKARKILFWAIRHKLRALCYAMLTMQNNVGKRAC